MVQATSTKGDRGIPKTIGYDGCRGMDRRSGARRVDGNLGDVEYLVFAMAAVDESVAGLHSHPVRDHFTGFRDDGVSLISTDEW